MRKAQEQDESQGKVPKELREKLKKAKAAKGLLRDLEEQVRMFVKGFEGKEEKDERHKKAELDSEDEEIVFVGRNGKMQDVPPSPRFRDSMDEEDFDRDRLVFESLEHDRGANFGYVVQEIFTADECTDTVTAAGLFTPLRPTMVFGPGRSLLGIRLGGKLM